ncbi:SirA family protein [Paenibacillus sp. D9]|uniref:sulfurtransferase-like selenium metabolism protein YedF n=1 Tax=Paenibacillus sp. D9 TaxID=665792 RepID=UPI00061FA9F7|nr:sulfurtransferase-like selenium metabolism protein YedF [Paenibacillus sp. D9]KKC46324.1 SirA family protein [Paenibacillus sp. D9]
MSQKQPPTVDYTLDVRGESCPYPVIYTLETLTRLQKGQLLQVVADCPASFRNVPEEVVKHGYKMEMEPKKNGRELVFYIRA